MAKYIEIGVTSLQSVLDCSLCFWISERVGSPPSIFPGIPSQVDSVIKNYMKLFVGRSDLPKWFPVRGTLLETGQTIRARDPGTGIVLKGVLDALVRTPDGKYHIVDYKTGRPSEEVPSYYQMQLDGYAYLLEHNSFRPVGSGVLLYFTPAQGDLSEGLFPFKITAVRTRVYPSRIPPVLARAKQIIESEIPPPRSENCEMCIWREQATQTLPPFPI
jgi:CRISPR/Cas system-associated exonuclease Cas4 (RecB family)